MRTLYKSDKSDNICKMLLHAQIKMCWYRQRNTVAVVILIINIDKLFMKF